MRNLEAHFCIYTLLLSIDIKLSLAYTYRAWTINKLLSCVLLCFVHADFEVFDWIFFFFVYTFCCAFVIYIVVETRKLCPCISLLFSSLPCRVFYVKITSFWSNFIWKSEAIPFWTLFILFICCCLWIDWCIQGFVTDWIWTEIYFVTFWRKDDSHHFSDLTSKNWFYSSGHLTSQNAQVQSCEG